MAWKIINTKNPSIKEEPAPRWILPSKKANVQTVVGDTTGEVKQKQSKHDKELGEEHPFDYKQLEGLYKQFGLCTAIVDKTVDFVWGSGFHTLSKDERAKNLIDRWLKETDFKNTGRRWLKQALIKGQSPLELGGKDETKPPMGCKVLRADNFFVKRNSKGKIETYYQARKRIGGSYNSKDAVAFKPFQIAHLNINTVDDEPYGCGIVMPMVKYIDWLIQNQKAMHKLMERKANSPIVAKLGSVEREELPSQEEVDAFASQLTWMNNLTEWAVSADIDLQVLDFGNFGEKFEAPIRSDFEMIMMAGQVPEVILGMGSIPEGLAKVQMDTWERRVRAIQTKLESIIELQIFRRILRAAKIEADVEFVWGEKSQTSKEARIGQILTALQNPLLAMKLREALELQLAELMDIDPSEVETDESERERELDANQPAVPGENNERHDFSPVEIAEGVPFKGVY